MGTRCIDWGKAIQPCRHTAKLLTLLVLGALLCFLQCMHAAVALLPVTKCLHKLTSACKCRVNMTPGSVMAY